MFTRFLGSVCSLKYNLPCSIVSNLNGHANLIGYVDSTISLLDGDVHEVLLLMPYHKVTLLQMMNERLNSGTESNFHLCLLLILRKE